MTETDKRKTHVLISGAGIGGTALAHWLDRHGCAVTVVERAPGLRLGGQAVDVRGPALEVADLMGITDRLRALRTAMRGMSVVDREGKELYRSTEHTLSGGALDSPDIEIMRDDLARVLYEATPAGRVTWLWDDTVTALRQDASGVDVTFARSAPRRFDYVVGADGQHSAVRALAFGATPLTHLGTYLAVFTTPNFLGLDRWQTWCTDGRVGGCFMTARENTELRVYAGFESAEPIVYDHRDRAAQEALILRHVADAGWEFPQALKYMSAAPDFHFDSMSQVRLDRWSRGRVTLLGDAGYCASPLSGMGTTLAMVAAYVLAGELATSEAPLAAYESRLRPYATAVQALALTNRSRMDASTPEPPEATPLPPLPLQRY